MPRSPSSGDPADDTQDLQDFIARLYQRPDRQAVASEIEVLQSIYGEDAIHVWTPGSSTNDGTGTPAADPRPVRYTLNLSLPSYDTVLIKLLVSLPATYPVSSPPQLQLLSRYLGAFGADSTLFGSILRTFISVSGVEFTPETVCVFDGVQNVLERCNAWYEDRLNEDKVKDLVRGDEKESVGKEVDTGNNLNLKSPSPPQTADSPDDEVASQIKFFIAEPIVDRKSSFIGRACRISDPSEVPQIIAHLMSDRRIARAAHPVIHAWRCQVSNVLHQDNDDDGETAAGGRLAHLLQILEVNDVLVVVTRYFGGINLGPDRFKHINQAARNALELGGFLDGDDKMPRPSRGKRH